MTVTLVRKGKLGSTHAALSIRHTACGLPLTRSYEMMPKDSRVTCPNCNHLLYGRKTS